MEVDERRTPDAELGPQLAAGRDATIHAVGDDRVLRRTGPGRDLLTECLAMEHVRAAGYPVPQVFRVGPGEMVMARVDGPTMLEDLEVHPWRLRRHARTLAALHTRLHEIAPPVVPTGSPGALPAHPVAGTSVLHQDLHPGNVICSPAGAVVIDWNNVCQGDAAADVALSWILMAAFELDIEPPSGPFVNRIVTRVERRATPWIRRRLVDAFLAASGIEERVRAALPAAAEYRLQDPSVRPGEVTAIQALVARESMPA